MPRDRSMNNMDAVLQSVNVNFITLQDDERKDYMAHYQRVTEELMKVMKSKDKLFDAIYQRLIYAGSFYDGLRVGKPDEFDVDVVMKIPINYDTVEFSNAGVKPPFVKVKMIEISDNIAKAKRKMKELPRLELWTEVYKYMEKWTDEDGFLLQGVFRQWMESVVCKALISLPRAGLSTFELQINGYYYNISLRKTGPAMTLNIEHEDIVLDVDLVPVIEFMSPKKWPPSPVRENTAPRRESWFIVPKPNSRFAHEYQDTYWRLAFHEQEREMISGNEMGHLKNACRLLKKFRDRNNMKSVASYYIKTMFLWEIDERKYDTSFWRSSLSLVFMTMLKKLAENIKYGNIDYFWDDRYNLICGMSHDERCNVENRMNKIIRDIEIKSVDDPTIIAFHLLTPGEYCKFVNAYRTLHYINESYIPERAESPPPDVSAAWNCIIL